MVIGIHLIMTYYGFWLPNDPRGSWSDFVASWELLRFGKAMKTAERRSLARVEHDHSLRLAAKRALKYRPVELDDRQRRAASIGFARAIEESGYPMHACAILGRHTHLVLGRLERPIGQVVAHLKGRATQSLRAEGIHPLERFVTSDGTVPTMWTEMYWKVFLDAADNVARAVRYVELNPQREGEAAQHWSFVAPFSVGR